MANAGTPREPVSPGSSGREVASPPLRRASVYKECFLCKQTIVKQIPSPEGHVPTPCESCLKHKRLPLTSSPNVKLVTIRTPSVERLEDIPEDDGVNFSSSPRLNRKRNSVSLTLLSPTETEAARPTLPSPEELGLPNEGQRYFSFLVPQRDRTTLPLRSPKDIIQEFIRYEEGLRASEIYKKKDDVQDVGQECNSSPSLNHHVSLPAGLDWSPESLEAAGALRSSRRSAPALGGSAVDLSALLNMDSSVSLLEKHCVGSPQASPRAKRHTFAGVTEWPPGTGIPTSARPSGTAIPSSVRPPGTGITASVRPNKLDIPLLKIDSQESLDSSVFNSSTEVTCCTCGETDHTTCDSPNNSQSQSAIVNNNNSTDVKKSNHITIVVPETDNDEFKDDLKIESKPNTFNFNPTLLNPWQIWQQRRDSNIDDLDQLKAVTARLHLETRRESYVTWRENYVDKPYLWRHRIAHEVVNKQIEDDWSAERIGRINEAIIWVKRELMDMRSQDQELARRLIALRKDISEYRLEKSVAEHREIIEEAVEQEEEKREDLAELIDAPPDQFCSMLKEFGVTRLNINSRRFSVF